MLRFVSFSGFEVLKIGKGMGFPGEPGRTDANVEGFARTDLVTLVSQNPGGRPSRITCQFGVWA